MNYFNRLTEIITCNLTALLKESQDPSAAIQKIVAEMEEGLMGARRSVATAAMNEERLSREILEHLTQSEQWLRTAREALQANREQDARDALLRRREIEDLLAGLYQQQQAAAATREHLMTMQRALEARLTEAMRRRAALLSGEPLDVTEPVKKIESQSVHISVRHSELDAELDALRRELGLPIQHR